MLLYRKCNLYQKIAEKPCKIRTYRTSTKDLNLHAYCHTRATISILVKNQFIKNDKDKLFLQNTKTMPQSAEHRFSIL